MYPTPDVTINKFQRLEGQAKSKVTTKVLD